MKSLGHMTVVKITKSIMFDGNVSEKLLDKFYGRFHSNEKLKNQDDEIIEGEIIDGYIESIILLGEAENQDEFLSLKNRNKLHIIDSFVFKNEKTIEIDDIIFLKPDSDSFYTIVKLNNLFLLSNSISKECILLDREFCTLSQLENYLIDNFPNYSLLGKTK